MTVPKSARDRRAIFDAALAEYQADRWWIKKRTDLQATINKRERRPTRWDQLVGHDGEFAPPYEGAVVLTHVRVVTVDDHGAIAVRKAKGRRST